MLFIDAENAIYGKLSAYIAKQLLNGEEVTIVNANKVAVTGGRDFVLQKFLERRNIGSFRKGPFYPRTADQILRRSIGDMLPKKTTRGKEALSRCFVYSDFPADLKSKDFVKIDKAENNKVSGFVTLSQVARILGGKVKE